MFAHAHRTIQTTALSGGHEHRAILIAAWSASQESWTVTLHYAGLTLLDQMSPRAFNTFEHGGLSKVASLSIRGYELCSENYEPPAEQADGYGSPPSWNNPL